MRKWFRYRGIRLRLYQTHDVLNWALLISSPFLLLLAAYHYFVTYPKFSKMTDFQDWKIYLQPAVVSLVVILAAAFLSLVLVQKSRMNDGFFMRKFKIQMLARFMLSNNLVNQSRPKSRDAKPHLHFPRAYYLHKEDTDVFTFETGNKFHHQVITLGKTLSEMYLGDLTKISWEMGFISYEFLMNNLQKRITFEEVTAKDGRITLMNGVVWAYDKLPHMLIIGGTGGGKTYFIYSLIFALVKEGRVHCADPKMADLAEFANFSAFKGLVVSDKAGIIAQMQEAVDLMDKRYLYMKQLPNYTLGENYRFYGMPPEFFIIDEISAYVSTLNGREYEEFFSLVTPLVLKARQAGVYLIFATQRPDTSTLPGGIRDNLSCRVSLGRLSPAGYDMGFPDSKDKAFVNKEIVGRGYIDVGTGIPIEFYSPLVAGGFDFVSHFQNIPAMKYTDVSKIELTPKAKEELNEIYDWLGESESDFLQQNQAEILAEFNGQKEKKIEQLEAKANIPSYRDKLRNGT